MQIIFGLCPEPADDLYGQQNKEGPGAWAIYSVCKEGLKYKCTPEIIVLILKLKNNGAY